MNKSMARPVDSRVIILDLDLGRSPGVFLSLGGGSDLIEREEVHKGSERRGRKAR